MVTWKCFSLDNDLESVLGWTAEARHQEVQVRSQGSHDRYFTRSSSNHWCHQSGPSSIYINERREQLVLVRHEVAHHAFDRPGSQVLVDILPGITRLQTERVPAEIYASRIGGIFFYLTVSTNQVIASSTLVWTRKACRKHVPSVVANVFLLRSFFDGMMNSSRKSRRGSLASRAWAYSLLYARMSSL